MSLTLCWARELGNNTGPASVSCLVGGEHKGGKRLAVLWGRLVLGLTGCRPLGTGRLGRAGWTGEVFTKNKRFEPDFKQIIFQVKKARGRLKQRARGCESWAMCSWLLCPRAEPAPSLWLAPTGSFLLSRRIWKLGIVPGNTAASWLGAVKYYYE